MAAAKDNDGEPDIPEVRTDPPPPGEEDPYGAATRVGPMSPNAIAKMMRDTEVPNSSGLRNSLPVDNSTSTVNTPVPTVAPDVSAMFNDALSKADESNTRALAERARDLQDLKSHAPAPLAPAALDVPATTPATSSGPPRPQLAFPDWIQTATRDTEDRRNEEHRRFLTRGAAVAAVLFVVIALLVWWLFSTK